MDATRNVSKKFLKTLETRALRLAEKVERATQDSPERAIREGGSRLADVLEEWMQEINDMLASGDSDLEERALSFHTRLTMAEAKVDEWHIPPAKKKKKKASTPRRRARKRKTAA